MKAFEYHKDDYVRITDEDFELARAEATRAIEISDFVPLTDIDPLLFAKAYYVGPGAGGERVYALLARAMEDADLAAIVKFVMRDQQHLGALRVADGLIVLEQLHFADELRPAKGIKPEKQRISEAGARTGRQPDRLVQGTVAAREVQGHLPRRALPP